jgi:hypothetical protein
MNYNYKNLGKKSLKSTQQTIDMNECIEKSVEKEKNELSSPSAVKPLIQQSPRPTIMFDPIIKKINFEKIEKSPLLQEATKRKVYDCAKTAKKFKKTDYSNAFVEFFDPETKEFQRFNCFPDSLTVENRDVTKRLSQNECDDDCATNKDLICVSKQHLIDQITNSLLNFEDKRKTL